MRKAAAVVLVVLAATIFVAHTYYLRCVAEDAFITFRFAENLAGGHGFTWNIGEAPVEGFTNFLWVVVCAAAIRAGLDVVLFAQVAGTAAGVGIVFLAYLFAVRGLDCRRDAALAACFMLVLCGPLATWAASGMETVPFAFFVLLGTYYAVLFCREQKSFQGVASALAMLTASLLRPEGVMAFTVGFGVVWVLWDRQRERSRMCMLIMLALFAVPGALYFLWRYRYFGYLLPNTFYAKTGGGISQQLRGLRYALDYSVFYVLPMLPLAALAAWAYVPQGRSHLRMEPVKNAARRPIRRWDPRNFLLRLFASISRVHSAVAVCVALVVFYAAYIVYVGGDYMAMYRFWVPMVPLIALLFGWMTDVVLKAAGGTGIRRTLAFALIALTCLAVLWPSTPLEALVLRKPKYHHGRFQGVYRERWHTSRLAAIGEFFRQYRNDYSETLATDAIGAIGYCSNMKILGMHGLVDRHIAHLKEGHAELGTGFPGHEKGDLAYIFSRIPTYYMFNRTLTPKPLGWPAFGPDLDSMVRADYKLESAWLKDPGNGEVGFFTFLVRMNKSD